MSKKIIALALGDNRINLIDKSEIGELNNLTTNAKDNIVNAINEVSNKQGIGVSYTEGNGIDITGDSISITQANLNKIADIDNKADKTTLNSYYTKTETNNLLNAKATTQALTDETNARTTKDAELSNQIVNKIDKINTTDGTLFNTGITLDSKQVYKVIYRDLATQGNNISTLVTQLINSNSLLDTKVYGYSTMEDDGTIHFPISNLMFYQNSVGVIIININTIGTVSQNVKQLDGSLTNVTAIEVTYLG